MAQNTPRPLGAWKGGKAKVVSGDEAEWLDDEAKKMLLAEAQPGGSGFEETLLLLPEKTQRLIREVIKRREIEISNQGRVGSPASDINIYYPTILYLIKNGVSSADAWGMLQEHIPRRDAKDAKRQLNRARSEVEKAAHEAAAAVVGGKPQTFNTAFDKLRQLFE